jgi:hypothetical protein
MGTVNTNYIHKEFMTRLYSRNIPYIQFGKFYLLISYLKIKILPVAPHGSGFHPTHTHTHTTNDRD